MSENFCILLVEDCESDAFLLQHALRKAGIKSILQTVSHGQQAIDYLAGLKQYSDRKLFPFPDLMILDLRMPMKDGFEVLDWIRQQPSLAGLRVVTMSGCDLQATVDRVKKLGAVAYIMKRSNLASLGTLFKTVIGNYEQMRLQAQNEQENLKPDPPPFLDGRFF